jgi:hypothetical protein
MGSKVPQPIPQKTIKAVPDNQGIAQGGRNESATNQVRTVPPPPPPPPKKK